MSLLDAIDAEDGQIVVEKRPGMLAGKKVRRSSPHRAILSVRGLIFEIAA